MKFLNIVVSRTNIGKNRIDLAPREQTFMNAV
jgi:hypothetical protein